MAAVAQARDDPYEQARLRNAARLSPPRVVSGERDPVVATREHIDIAWQCRVRPLVGCSPVLQAVTVNDIVRALLLLEIRRIAWETHPWLDVDLARWNVLRSVARECQVPALVAVRFDDRIVFVDAQKVGPSPILLGEHTEPRVRLNVKIMAPVTSASRW